MHVPALGKSFLCYVTEQTQVTFSYLQPHSEIRTKGWPEGFPPHFPTTIRRLKNLHHALKKARNQKHPREKDSPNPKQIEHFSTTVDIWEIGTCFTLVSVKFTSRAVGSTLVYRWGEWGAGEEQGDKGRSQSGPGSPDWHGWPQEGSLAGSRQVWFLKVPESHRFACYLRSRLSLPGMWNEMNEWTVFRLLVKGWTQKSRPHWGSNH